MLRDRCPSFFSQRFRQPEINRGQVEKSKRGSRKSWQSVPFAGTQCAAHGRPDDHTQAESGADQPQAFGPVLLVGHIRNVGLGDGDITSNQSVQYPAGEQQPQDDGVFKRDGVLNRRGVRDEARQGFPKRLRQTQ